MKAVGTIATVFLLSIGILYGAATDVSGVILDLETGSPVENAVIKINELDLVTISDKAGKFIFERVRPHEYGLLVSRMGYRTESRKFVITKDSPVSMTIYLTPSGIMAPSVIVSANQYNTKFQELIEESHLLEGKKLQFSLGQTLAATLKNEVGVAVRSMGPAPARPVIRGLGGSRVVILEDGFQSNDLSAASPDHAVAVDPVNADQIEIIRGPKVLLYTSSSIGGVVNVEDNEIPLKLQSNGVYEAAIHAESVNSGLMGFADAEIPLSPIVLKGEFSIKSAGNYSAPGKVLQNSDSKSMHYSAGASTVIDGFSAGFSLSEFNLDYGIPGGFVGSHPKGVDIEMLKRTFNAKSVYHVHSELVDNIQLNFSRTYYHHTEYEYNGSVGAEFVFRDYNLNLNINHHDLGPFSTGTLGAYFALKESKMGGFVFTPATNESNLALFFYEDIKLGKHYLQMSARYSYDKLTPQGDAAPTNLPPTREFNNLSVDISLMHELFSSLFLGFDISRTTRPPTLEDLYSQGPHLAAYSYDIGNPNLKSETGYGVEIFAFFKNKFIFTSLTAFWDEMDYFILPRNTGDTNYAQLLPIYQTSGLPARLLGVEFQINCQPYDKLALSAGFGYTYGEIASSGAPLPMIPPLKGMIELKYGEKDFILGIRNGFALDQQRIDLYETPTKGYLEFGCFAQYLFSISKLINTITISADNLLNANYYNHLSRIKSIIPEPGRNFRIMYKLIY